MSMMANSKKRLADTPAEGSDLARVQTLVGELDRFSADLRGRSESIRASRKRIDIAVVFELLLAISGSTLTAISFSLTVHQPITLAVLVATGIVFLLGVLYLLTRFFQSRREVARLASYRVAFDRFVEIASQLEDRGALSKALRGRLATTLAQAELDLVVLDGRLLRNSKKRPSKKLFRTLEERVFKGEKPVFPNLEATSRSYTYRKYVIEYHVGTTPFSDKWRREMLVEPDTGKSLTNIPVSLSGASPGWLSFGRYWQRYDARGWINGQEANVLPVAYAKGIWYLRVLAEQPLDKMGSPHSIVISGTASGTWNALRRIGQDSGSFSLHSEAKVLEITIILPSTADVGSLVMVGKPPSTPTSSTTLRTAMEGNRPGITWRIEGARPGIYRYIVRAPAITRLRKFLNWLTRTPLGID